VRGGDIVTGGMSTNFWGKGAVVRLVKAGIEPRLAVNR